MKKIYNIFKSCSLIFLGALFILCLVSIALFFFCTNDKGNDFYLEEFKENKSAFENALNYLAENYLNDSVFLSESAITIRFKESEFFSGNGNIVDNILEQKLKCFNISKIRAWKDSECNSGYLFSKVVFVINADHCIPFASVHKSYRFHFCKSGTSYRDYKIESIPLGGNWSFYVDESFP